MVSIVPSSPYRYGVCSGLHGGWKVKVGEVLFACVLVKPWDGESIS